MNLLDLLNSPAFHARMNDPKFLKSINDSNDTDQRELQSSLRQISRSITNTNVSSINPASPEKCLPYLPVSHKHIMHHITHGMTDLVDIIRESCLVHKPIALFCSNEMSLAATHLAISRYPNQYQDIIFLQCDANKNHDIVSHYNVTAYPTIIILINGVVLTAMVGFEIPLLETLLSSLSSLRQESLQKYKYTQFPIQSSEVVAFKSIEWPRIQCKLKALLIPTCDKNIYTTTPTMYLPDGTLSTPYSSPRALLRDSLHLIDFLSSELPLVQQAIQNTTPQSPPVSSSRPSNNNSKDIPYVPPVTISSTELLPVCSPIPTECWRALDVLLSWPGLQLTTPLHLVRMLLLHPHGAAAVIKQGALRGSHPTLIHRLVHILEPIDAWIVILTASRAFCNCFYYPDLREFLLSRIALFRSPEEQAHDRDREPQRHQAVGRPVLPPFLSSSFPPSPDHSDMLFISTAPSTTSLGGLGVSQSPSPPLEISDVATVPFSPHDSSDLGLTSSSSISSLSPDDILASSSIPQVLSSSSSCCTEFLCFMSSHSVLSITSPASSAILSLCINISYTLYYILSQTTSYNTHLIHSFSQQYTHLLAQVHDTIVYITTVLPLSQTFELHNLFRALVCLGTMIMSLSSALVSPPHAQENKSNDTYDVNREIIIGGHRDEFHLLIGHASLYATKLENAYKTRHDPHQIISLSPECMRVLQEIKTLCDHHKTSYDAIMVAQKQKNLSTQQ